MPSPLPSPSPSDAFLSAAASGGFDIWTVVLGPAATAAVVAGLFTVIQMLVTGKRDRRRQLLEFRLRQTNELYAPILLLLAEDAALIDKLREAAAEPGKDWHLLDNLDRVRKNSQLLPVAERIVEVNLAIKDILMKNAGLVLNDLPPSFRSFISHADLLSGAVKTGKVPKNVGLKYFPHEFETDIKMEQSNLVKAVRDSLGGS